MLSLILTRKEATAKPEERLEVLLPSKAAGIAAMFPWWS
jgi:hypothetical protein